MSASEAERSKRLQRTAGIARGSAWRGAGLALFLVVLPGPLAGEPARTLAGRAVLYEEDAFSSGKTFPGSVVWRVMPYKPPVGQPDDVAIHADIEIPERQLKLTLVMHRNFDAAVPASHLIELNFTLPPDFPGFGIDKVPGMLMKPNESARGAPFAGLSVKNADTSFRIGLAGTGEYRAKNMALFRDNAWMDIPIVYSTQVRAILAIEKGASNAIFEDALAAWGRNP